VPKMFVLMNINVLFEHNKTFEAKMIFKITTVLFIYHVVPVIGFIQPGSTLFKNSAILVPKLTDPPFWWKSNSTPSKSGSGLPDLD
jgi:hypothetical protein